MKKLVLALAALGLAATTVGATAGPVASPPNGILGILGTNGTFRPILGTGHDGVAPPPPKTFVGTLRVTLNITVVSNLPSGTGILCGLIATVTGVAQNGASDTIIDTGQKLASGSGSTATCQVDVPYEWRLLAYDETAILPDSVALSYSITALGTGEQGRTTVASFDTIALPKNGKTTAYALNARI